MAEQSFPWAGTAIGDAGPYSDDDWDDIWEVLFGSGASPYNDRGVIKNWANELAGTDGGANTFDVATGAALVHGKFYKNTAVVNVNIPSSVGAWREDLICLHQSWLTQTTRIYRHANPADGVGYPAPTQTDGSCWEIPLWAVRINNAGAITLITDLRDYVSDLMQPKQLQVWPKNISGVDVVKNYHPGISLDPTDDECGFEFMVPLDFKGLVAVYLRFIPETTGSVTYSIWMRAGGCGENCTAVGDNLIDAVATVIADIVECEDITAAFDGLQAGDQVGIVVRNTFLVDDEVIVVVQLDFRYK